MTTITLPSRSAANVFYTLTVSDGGIVTCDCPAGRHGKKCWHRSAVATFAQPAPAPAPNPSYRLASARTGKTISTHATLDEAVAAKAAVNRAGGMAFVDEIA